MNRAHERWVTAAAQTLQLAAFPQQNHLIYAVFRVKKAAATGGSSSSATGSSSHSASSQGRLFGKCSKGQLYMVTQNFLRFTVH
jgi:hypothetical protein